MTTTSSEGLAPGTGTLLAFTTGNGRGEAAWFAGSPPVEVTVNGLFLASGEHLWVSLATGGYLRQHARGGSSRVCSTGPSSAGPGPCRNPPELCRR